MMASTREIMLRYRSHERFMQSCLREGIVPTGFRLKWEMQLECAGDLLEKCEKIKKDAAMRLMEISLKACQRKIRNIELTECDIQEETGKMHHQIGSLEYDLMKKKEKKLRDLRNFEVNFLNPNIDSNDFTIKKVKADGNCFYRSISLSLFKKEERHILTRKEVVNHMKLFEDTYGQYIDGDFQSHIANQSFTDGRIESWATEAEVLAAAQNYCCEICILKVVGRETEKLVFKPLSGRRVKQKIFLKLENEHFDVLSLKSRTPQPFEQTMSSPKIIDWFDFSEHIESSCGMDIQKTCNNHTSSFSVTPQNTTKYAIPQNFNSKKGFTKLHDEKKFKDLKRVVRQKENMPKKTKEACVTNLSSRILSDAEMDLLSKGQSFVPTRKRIDIHKLHSDLAEWERRMRLAEYFYDKETDREHEDNFKVNKESRFTPDPGRDKWLDAYIKAVKDDIINGLNNNVRANLNKTEQEALRSLLNDTSIVIRSADKGSGLVITDTDKYVEGLENEIQDGKCYRITDGKEQSNAEKRVKQLANKMYREGVITKGLKEYLVPKYPVRGKLKGNPKTHKKNNPFRTVVSGIGTSTERMAEVAEKELNAFVEESPSFIRDTGDFLKKLESGTSDPLPHGTILFCFDVVKLYPSIPRKEGVEACERALQERQRGDIPTDQVLEMIKVVLDNNVFEFAGNEYLQTEGVAIGSRLGRNFACSYMRTWDEKLLQHYKLPVFYKRYIDDGIGIWTHSQEELMRFHQHANSIHPNIQVELRWSYNCIEFLDTKVRLRGGRIETDLYSKPTDKHQYVQVRSDHPVSVKKSIPYGLGIRIKRICSNEEDYRRHRINLKMQLRKRGYSSRFIESQLTKVDKMNRRDILQKKTPNLSKERVPLVVTYSRQLPKLHNIVRKHMSKLYRSSRLKEIFEKVPIIAYRRDKNLGDILIHRKTNKALNVYHKPENMKCQKACKVCIMLDRGLHNKRHVEGITFPLQQECRAHNIVYGVYCNKCDRMVYVGETSRSLKERLKEHEADVRLVRCKAMSGHFNGQGHSTEDIGVSVLETIKDPSRYYRLIREVEWIKRFQTEYPDGLNTKTQLDVLIRGIL